MDIEYDDDKRALTLEHRGLDFAHADRVFEGRKTVMVVWTPRGGARRIISMRECNVREREAYQRAVG